MENDYQPFAALDNGNSDDVERPENSAGDERPSNVSHRETAGEMPPREAPREAWKSSDDQRRNAVADKPEAKTANAPGGRPRQSLWLTRTKRFCYEASVVGLRYVVNPTASPFRRIVWLLLLLVGAAFTAFQIQNRVSYFLSRPVSVNLRIQHAEEIRFPTVTICNENRIMYSLAAEYGKRTYSFIHSFIYSFIH